MGLYAEDDVLLGAAPRVLAKEQTGSETGRLAHHGDMSRLPHLAVFVHQSVTPAGRAVPDALLGPDGWMTGGVKSQREQENKRMSGKYMFKKQKKQQVILPEGVG